MSAYLIKTVETYRVANEKEANDMIKKAQESKDFDLKKYNSEYRSQKSKGEIVDEWYRVTLTKEFNDEKEPGVLVSIDYFCSDGFFPSPVAKDVLDFDDEEDENE